MRGKQQIRYLLYNFVALGVAQTIGIGRLKKALAAGCSLYEIPARRVAARLNLYRVVGHFPAGEFLYYFVEKAYRLVQELVVLRGVVLLHIAVRHEEI